MSETAALRFIERVAGDLALQSRLRRLEPPGDLEQVVRIAAHAGFEFDVEELRAAFATDYEMRRRFYGAVSRQSHS